MELFGEIDTYINKCIVKYDLVANKRMAIIHYNNIGDWYSLCSSIKEATNILKQEFILLYVSEKQREIASWFNYDGYELPLYKITEEEYKLLRSCDDNLIQKYKEYIVFWGVGPNIVSKYTMNGSPLFVKNLRRPRVKPINKEYYINEYGVKPGNTIYVVPSANYIKPFPDWFWNFSIEVFRTIGFAVVVNGNSKDAHRYNALSIDVPLEDAIGFADLCGYVFGVRTGFFDLLSSSSAKMTIFSPRGARTLDVAHNISNEDNRIQTFFYADNDLFFEKTYPLSLVENEIEQRYKAYWTNMNENKELHASLMFKSVTAYKYISQTNRTNHDKKFEISAFWLPKYSLVLENNVLIFILEDFRNIEYRVDVRYKYYDTIICELINIPTNCSRYQLEKSGKYSVQVIVTDKKTCNQQIMLTHEVLFCPSFQNGLESLRGIIDIKAYIDVLVSFLDDVVVLISSRDAHTCAGGNNGKVSWLKKLSYANALGIVTNLVKTYRYSYVAVIDCGTVLYEESSPNQVLEYEGYMEEHKIRISSNGYKSTGSDKVPIEISVDGRDYAVNHRGLNIVVWDKKTDKLLDSVCFDMFGNEAVYRTEECEE